MKKEDITLDNLRLRQYRNITNSQIQFFYNYFSQNNRVGVGKKEDEQKITKVSMNVTKDLLEQWKEIVKVGPQVDLSQVNTIGDISSKLEEITTAKPTPSSSTFENNTLANIKDNLNTYVDERNV